MESAPFILYLLLLLLWTTFTVHSGKHKKNVSVFAAEHALRSVFSPRTKETFRSCVFPHFNKIMLEIILFTCMLLDKLVCEQTGYRVLYNHRAHQQQLTSWCCSYFYSSSAHPTVVSFILMSTQSCFCMLV